MKLKDLLFWRKRKKPSCATKRCFFWKELGCVHASVRCPYQDLTNTHVCSLCYKVDVCNNGQFGYGCMNRPPKKDEDSHVFQGRKHVYLIENGEDVTDRVDNAFIVNHLYWTYSFFCIYKINLKKKKIALADIKETDDAVYIEKEKDVIYRKALNMFDLIQCLRIEGVL